MVEYISHEHEVEGLNPATGTLREDKEKQVFPSYPLLTNIRCIPVTDTLAYQATAVIRVKKTYRIAP